MKTIDLTIEIEAMQIDCERCRDLLQLAAEEINKLKENSAARLQMAYTLTDVSFDLVLNIENRLNSLMKNLTSKNEKWKEL